MFSEAQPPRRFQQYLAVGGPLPGIPGIHGPGLYDIDYEARTATRVIDSPALAEEVAPPPAIPAPPISSGG